MEKMTREQQIVKASEFLAVLWDLGVLQYRISEENKEVIFFNGDSEECIRFKDLKNYVKSDIEIEVQREKNEQIKKVGEFLASLWGGKFIKHEVDEIKQEVIFYCAEHGENFVTSCTFTEMREYLKMV